MTRQTELQKTELDKATEIYQAANDINQTLKRLLVSSNERCRELEQELREVQKRPSRPHRNSSVHLYVQRGR